MNRRIVVRLIPKPIPISPEYRIEYKICMIILVLELLCRGKKASINKINFIIANMSSVHGMKILKKIEVAQDIYCDFDKTLYKTITVALADKLITFENGQVVLMKKGEELVKVMMENSIFTEEYMLLKSKKKDFITEKKLK